MDKKGGLDLAQKALEILSEHPALLGVTVVLCVLAWRTPQIIKSCGYVLRENKKLEIEVARRQEAARRRLESEIARKEGANK